ncbi:MAG: hypothetical protein ACXAB7_11185 [Candidatus Kariarchaeaceae archaeon]
MKQLKVPFDKIKVSGKGFFAEEHKEWVDDNIKLTSPGVEFHEVVYDNEEQVRIGWLVMGAINILADFTAHTDDGMIGKSVEDHPEYCLIYDKTRKLGDFITETLIEVDTTNSQKLLEKYILEKGEFNKNINIDDDDEDVFIIISTKSELIYVQTNNTSIRLVNGEVMVLNRKEDKLTMVSKEEGMIHIGAEKSITIGNGKISIDGQEFSPEKIAHEVKKAVSSALSSLSMKL